MYNNSMPGLSAVLSASKKTNIDLIDRIDLKDQSTGASLASLWRKFPQGGMLMIDFVDTPPQSSVSEYILTNYTDVILEGILIAKHILQPLSTIICLRESTPIPDFLLNRAYNFEIMHADTVPYSRHQRDTVIHNAETIWTIARFFRREGADKRIWKIICKGRNPVYREIPKVYTLQAIAESEQIHAPIGARVGGTHGPIFNPENFHSILPLSLAPVIEFLTEDQPYP